MKRAASILCLAALLPEVQWAAEFWETKDYTSWTQKECEKLLTKSPWALQYVHTNFYRPATNISTGTGTLTEGQQAAGLEPQSGERESRIIFQFILVTAKPVRMARAELGLLQSPGMKAEAERFVNQPAGQEIVFEVRYASNPPSNSAIHDIQNYFRRAIVNDFQANTFLTSSDHKEPVHISRYDPPTEKRPFGFFVFPRYDDDGKLLFTGKEKSITLRSDLKIPIAARGGNETYSIFIKMDPKKMIFQNEFAF
jgi:hypothetical protein